MTTATISEGGHTYTIITDSNGNQISKILSDPIVLSAPPVILSKYQFRNLFTFAEKVAIDNFQTNSTLTSNQKQTMTTYIFDFQICDSVILSNSNVIAGVNLLETYGLIATGRASQVLANTKVS